MYTITVSEKGGQQSTFEFSTPEVTIGRMKGNDIVLPKGNVSKRHSRIFLRDGQFSIIDLGSTNGTYVNGRKITGEQSITDSDKVYIGDFILQVVVELEAAVPPMPPPAPGPPEIDMMGIEPLDEPQGADRFGMNPPPPPTAPHDLAPTPPSFGAPPAPAMDFGAPPAPAMDFGAPPAPAMDFGAPPAPAMDFGAPPAPAIDFGAPPAPAMDFGAPPAPAMDFGAPPAPAMDFGTPPAPAIDFGAPAAPAIDFGAPAAPAMDLGGPPTPSPALRKSPDMQSGWRPRQIDEPTVDRAGDRLMPNRGYSPSTVMSRQDLLSEFDPQFHAAQQDVARVLFEHISPDDLPFGYPPEPSDQERMRHAVSQAVNTVAPSVNRDELIELMTSECVGLGPLENYLDDLSIRDVYINRYDRILIRRNGKLATGLRAFSHPQLLVAAAHRLLGPRDMEVISDEIRFSDGTKVHIVMPPVATDGPAITVRKPPTTHPSLEELTASGAFSHGMAEFLKQAMESGRSVLIAGPTSSGKSTLLSALASRLSPSVRVVSVEDHTHIQLTNNAVRLEANLGAGVDNRQLVHTALSMHPDRIIVDECRGGEAYPWVTSAACGTEGSMATVHGNNAADALGRLESLCLLGSRDVSPRGIREQIARAVNIVVVVNRVTDGFRIQQITEVQGVDLDAFRLNDIFYYRVEGTGGEFHPTGYIPLFYEDLRHAGVDVDYGIFRE